MMLYKCVNNQIKVNELIKKIKNLIIFEILIKNKEEILNNFIYEMVILLFSLIGRIINDWIIFFVVRNDL